VRGVPGSLPGGQRRRLVSSPEQAPAAVRHAEGAAAGSFAADARRAGARDRAPAGGSRPRSEKVGSAGRSVGCGVICFGLIDWTESTTRGSDDYGLRSSMAQTQASTNNVRAAKAQPKDLPAPAETLIDYYRQMVLIRRFEEKCQEMYTKAKIGGFLH